MKFDINKLIARTLQIGVWFSMFLFCVAIAESFFKKSNLAYTSFFGILKGLYLLEPNAAFYAGIVILMLTPVVRVLFLVFGYFIERDYRFSLISALVFFILIFSVYFGIH
ncbi:hypothetical protein DESAMIL20_1760 [Desulfurella amilsii]|uniref:DUF1634 domain-containing protein n=1 Tax=Desulfurella amilsii TaxID=1562698 RepID=A0A1X4XXE1_9BACT|nr:DUF1634 domain-containing protein [Desulfurella amilsii]OSS42207.1 hypothetical protein DESAMIL20_1760 [Desulfurella amilsii]